MESLAIVVPLEARRGFCIVKVYLALKFIAFTLTLQVKNFRINTSYYTCGSLDFIYIAVISLALANGLT